MNETHMVKQELQFELDHIHDYNDYIVNGQHCAQNVSTMNKLGLLIYLMPTMEIENAFQLSSQYSYFPLHSRISNVLARRHDQDD